MRDELVRDKFMPFMRDIKIPMSDNPDPVKMLTSEAVKATWNS